jgi:uncharacterized membrane protein HdeD (DUF308 family)
MKAHHTRTHVTILLALAAFVLGLFIVVAPKATNVTNASATGQFGLDISGITRNAGDLPVEQFDAH